MTIHNTEYRTKFEMETDTGELFDSLEQKAQSAFMDIFASDDEDPFEIENPKHTVRWAKNW